MTRSAAPADGGADDVGAALRPGGWIRVAALTSNAGLRKKGDMPPVPNDEGWPGSCADLRAKARAHIRELIDSWHPDDNPPPPSAPLSKEQLAEVAELLQDWRGARS